MVTAIKALTTQLKVTGRTVKKTSAAALLQAGLTV